jgi:hypothetical protein
MQVAPFGANHCSREGETVMPGNRASGFLGEVYATPRDQETNLLMHSSNYLAPAPIVHRHSLVAAQEREGPSARDTMRT